MKKTTAAILSVLTAGALMFSLAGCTFFAPTPDPDDNTGGDDPIVTPEPDDPTPGPDDPNVSDDIGDNSWADWEDVFTGGSTEAYRLYQEAKADGFEGSFVDFLKEVGYNATVDSSYAVGTAVQSVVAISCVFDQYLTSPPLPDAEPEDMTYSGAGVIYSMD